MNRRKFVKCAGICAVAGIFAAKYGYDCYKNINSGDGIFNIDIPICAHCNLNCAYCDHFAPIAPVYEMPVEVLEKDMKQLSALTGGKVKRMMILGGEPLLHHDIEKVIETVEKYFKNTEKIILTNGLLLNDMKESFWEVCGKTGTKIKYTKYSKYKNYPKNFDTAENFARNHNVDFSMLFECTSFNKLQLTPEKKYDEVKNYNECPWHVTCATIYNGLLYSCCIQSSLQYLNAFFKDKQIPLYDSDSLDIHKISSINEIYDFFAKPAKICAHCGYNCDTISTAWKETERKSSEWYNESV